MKYNYNFKGKKIAVYVSSCAMDLEVSINWNGKSYDSVIKKDDNGKYFIFKKEKIYIENLRPFSFDDMVGKINDGKRVSPLEFLQATKDTHSVEIKYPYSGIQDKCLLMKSEQEEWKDSYKIVKPDNENQDNTLPKEEDESAKSKEREWFLTSYGLSFLLNMGLMKIVA